MLTIDKLKTYINEIKDLFPEINKTEVVIDDSQITSFLRDLTIDDCFVLIGIIPMYNISGNEDNTQIKSSTSLLLLNKVDRKGIDQEQFLEQMQATEDVARKLFTKLIEDKTNFTNGCPWLHQLDINSIEINPIWNLAGFDGWEIDFSLKSGLYE